MKSKIFDLTVLMIFAPMMVGASSAWAVDKPCTVIGVRTTVAEVCAQAGNTCTPTTVTIGSCTTLQANTQFDFGARDLIVDNAGTLQIDPTATAAPGEPLPWLLIQGATVTVKGGGTIRGTGTNGNGALLNPTAIRVLATTGDLVVDLGGLVISASRGLPGTHILLDTVATPGAQNSKPGNIIIAGEVRSNVQGQDIAGDPVYGGRLILPRGADEALRACLRGFHRQALHAAQLSFDHPRTGKRLVFDSGLPEDFRQLLAALAADSAAAALADQAQPRGRASRRR